MPLLLSVGQTGNYLSDGEARATRFPCHEKTA
jgi:hypothetical protein